MKIWIFLAVITLEGQPGIMHTPVTFFAEEQACKMVKAVFNEMHQVGKPDPDKDKIILAKQSWCIVTEGAPVGEKA